MQQLYAWTGLGRPISLQNTYHRLVLLSMAAAFLVSAAAYLHHQPGEFTSAAAFGLKLSLAIFFSWAICRELHPDAPAAALVAAGLAAIALWTWTWPQPQLLLLVHLLLLARLMNRSTGVPARPADAIMLIMLTAYLLYLGELMAGTLAALAFWVNATQPAPQPLHKYLALFVVLLVIAAIAYQPTFINFKALSIYTNIIIITLATGFALFSRKLKQLSSTADCNEEPLSLSRLRMTQLVVLLVVTVFSLWYGDSLFRALIPAWAAFGGVFLYAAFQKGSS